MQNLYKKTQKLFVGIGLRLELTVNPKLNGLIRPGDRAGSRLMLTLGVSGHSWPPVSIPADQGHMTREGQDQVDCVPYIKRGISMF